MNAYRVLAIVAAFILLAMFFGLAPVIKWLFTQLAEAVALIAYRLTRVAAIELHGPYANLTDLGALLLYGIAIAAIIKFLFTRKG